MTGGFRYEEGGCSVLGGHHAHVAAVAALLLELHDAIGGGEQRVVHTDAHVLAGVVLGAALAHDDVACDGLLTAVQLHTESFRVRFAAVLCTAFTFLVCHGSGGVSRRNAPAGRYCDRFTCRPSWGRPSWRQPFSGRLSWPGRPSWQQPS